jgi:hypothetical protein
MVQDKYHRMLVELLRPGTHTISEATVSRDIQYLHQQLGVNVKRYFMVGTRETTASQSLNSACRNVVDISTWSLMGGPTQLESPTWAS